MLSAAHGAPVLGRFLVLAAWAVCMCRSCCAPIKANAAAVRRRGGRAGGRTVRAAAATCGPASTPHGRPQRPHGPCAWRVSQTQRCHGMQRKESSSAGRMHACRRCVGAKRPGSVLAERMQPLCAAACGSVVALHATARMRCACAAQGVQRPPAPYWRPATQHAQHARPSHDTGTADFASTRPLRPSSGMLPFPQLPHHAPGPSASPPSTRSRVAHPARGRSAYTRCTRGSLVPSPSTWRWCSRAPGRGAVRDHAQSAAKPARPPMIWPASSRDRLRNNTPAA